MAVTLDATSNGNATVASSLTFAHTCAGANRVLVVGITTKGSSGANPVVSGVTYNGVAMTSIGGQAQGSRRVDLFRLVAPATGANNVVITMSASVDFIEAGSISVTGADQTTPVGTFASASGASGGATVDVAGAVGDLVVDAVYSDGATTAGSSPGAGQTQIYEVLIFDTYGGASYEAGAATVTMSWTLDGGAWAIGGVAIKASGGGAAAAPKMLLLGIG